MAISNKNSAITCIELIQNQNLDLSQYLIGKNSQGEIYLLEKSFFDNHVEIGKNPNHEDTKFPKLVESAHLMLSLLRSEPELRNHNKCAETAEKIYNVLNNAIISGEVRVLDLDEETCLSLNRIESHYKTLKYDLDKIPQAATEEQDLSPNRSTEIVPVESRKALHHADISNLVNTGLHILAHIPAYRRLLNPKLNPLSQRPDESIKSFVERKNAQMSCHNILKMILRGDAVEPQPIIEKLEWAFYDMKIQSCTEDLLVDFIHAAMKLFDSPSFASHDVIHVDHKMLKKPEKLQKTLEHWQLCNDQALPEVVILRNTGAGIHPFYPTITLGEATYSLEAIEEEASAPGEQNIHCVPWIQTENGDFARISDWSEESELVNKKQAAGLLRERNGWFNAHYVRVDSIQAVDESIQSEDDYDTSEDDYVTHYPILDQIVAYQNLFNTPLEQRPDESNDTYEARHDAQQALLSEHSNPVGVITKMNKALKEMGVNLQVCLEGGRSVDPLIAIMHICGNHSLWSVTAQGLPFSEKSLEKWQEKNKTQELPQAIRIVNSTGRDSCPPKMRFMGASYRLEAIEGHNSLWARSGNYQFIKHDRTTNEATLIKQMEVAEWVNQETEGWGAAHYIRIN
jgi:hypothetical protein